MDTACRHLPSAVPWISEDRLITTLCIELRVKTVKPANGRKGQNVLDKRVIKQLKNSWSNVKRSELMDLLVPFLNDGLGVKTPFQGVLKDRSEAFIWTISIFSSCIWVAL